MIQGQGNLPPFFYGRKDWKWASHRTSKRLLLKIYGKVNLMKISVTKGFALRVLSSRRGGSDPNLCSRIFIPVLQVA